MSLNQSRAGKSDAQSRRPGRSGNSGYQRSFSGVGGKGGGAATAPPSSGSSSASLSTNQSFKKTGYNGQGVQSRAAPAGTHSEPIFANPAARPVQNGAHVQSPYHGPSDAPVFGAVKPIDSSAPKSSQALPRAPSSQSASGTLDSPTPATPQKGVSPRPYAFQFGSISPAFMNGMQIPARTSSAPPNLDEQKRDQARHDSYKTAAPAPIPAVPKQQQPRKDIDVVTQSNTADSHPATQAKRDVQVQIPVAGPVATTNQKSSVLPIPAMQMPVSYQQQVPVQFSSPSGQIQSQAVTGSSLQIPMPLPIGNPAQVQPQVFVSNLQSHPLQSQGVMHQNQGIGFAPQMGHQLAPQLANISMGIAPQFSPHQPGKFGTARKTTVKITHPDTHEELRLDKRTDSYMDGGSTGPKSHTNAPPHSQPIQSFSPAHPVNFYAPMHPNSYNTPSIFFQTPTSLPPSSTQVAPGSSALRYNYAVAQGGPTVSIMNPSIPSPLSVSRSGPLVHGISEPLNFETSQVLNSSSSSSVQVTVKPAVASFAEKVGGTASVVISAPTVKGESPKLPTKPVDSNFAQQPRESELGLESSVQPKSAVSEGSAPVVSNTEGRRREPIRRSDSLKDQQKKLGKKEPRQHQQQHQADPADIVGALKLSSLRVSEDNGTATSLNVAQDSKNPENAKATSEVVGESTSVPGVLSSLEGTVSYAVVEPIKTDESKSMIPTMELSEKIFKEATEALSGSLPGSCDSSGKIINGVQIGEEAPCEQSKNSSLEMDVTTSEAGASKLDDASSCLVDRGLTIPESSEVELPRLVPQKGQTVGHKNTDVSSESSVRENDKRDMVESAGSSSDVYKTLDELVKSVTTSPDFSGVESAPSPPDAHQDKTSLTSSLDTSNIADEKAASHQDVAVFEGPPLPVSCEKKSTNGGSISASAPGPKDIISVDQNRPKSTGGRKKKKKELLMKADAAGATSDLYNAYKGPDEKTIEPPPISTGGLDCASIDPKQLVPNDSAEKDLPASEEDGQSKGEVDDWEDAEISTNQNISENGEYALGAKKHLDEIGATGKMKYSRDFLLSLSKHCTELPVSFERSEVTDAITSGPVGRTGGAPRADRRVGSIQDDDKWNKLHASGRDSRVDVYGSGPGQGGNHGVLKYSRGPPPGQYGGGILCGPMQTLGPHVGMPRNSHDADRWQRPTGLQKGLFPSPQTSAQSIHKAERKYEVGKVSDQEEAKQRQLKAILNKLTPQNFEKLFEQVKAVNIDNAVTLKGVISQIFDKALMEPTFCEMYANFCLHLAGELPDFSEDNEKITFKRLLLNKCQEEFERGEREEAEANRVEEEGEIKQSEEQREEKKTLAKRRMLGNIRLIGELYKKKMLTERIMHECIQKLLGQCLTPDEEDVEALCKLMSTIGEMIDHPKAKEYMDKYFGMMTNLSTNQKLSSRVRFMLKDSIDLRKNRWQQRRKVEGPKKIEEVHRDAAQERQLQTSRLSRGGPSTGSSARRGQQPMDYNTRGSSVLSSPGPQHMGGLRGFPNQHRGYGNQDVRIEERHILESRTVSVPLPQRPMDDESISLGPQGSLGRGMSISGQQPIMPNVPLAELSSVSGDPRRMGPGTNSYGSPANHYNMREELMPYRPAAYDQSNFQERNLPFGNRDMRNVDRSFERSRPTSPAYDPLNSQEWNLPYGNRDTRNVDRSFDRSRPTSPAIGRVQGGPLVSGLIVAPETEIYEDRLREMSIAAIREFYSARNEEEVWLCIKDLKAPGFYSNMVTLWVTDSFERKNGKDRELLAELLVNLNKSNKSRDGLLNQRQLIKGFESVLSSLEDAITDSPKAAEYLGRIFGKLILEDVVPLREIGKLIQDGGDELLQSGIASDVLVSVLEMIRKVKGDSGLKKIRMDSSLNLEDFRPPDPVKLQRLNEAFI